MQSPVQTPIATWVHLHATILTTTSVYGCCTAIAGEVPGTVKSGRISGFCQQHTGNNRSDTRNVQQTGHQILERRPDPLLQYLQLLNKDLYDPDQHFPNR